MSKVTGKGILILNMGSSDVYCFIHVNKYKTTLITCLEYTVILRSSGSLGMRQTPQRSKGKRGRERRRIRRRKQQFGREIAAQVCEVTNQAKQYPSRVTTLTEQFLNV
jgi:hypothetical protein